MDEQYYKFPKVFMIFDNENRVGSHRRRHRTSYGADSYGRESQVRQTLSVSAPAPFALRLSICSLTTNNSPPAASRPAMITIQKSAFSSMIVSLHGVFFSERHGTNGQKRGQR